MTLDVLDDGGPRRPGPSERLAVLEAENRALRERVERLERQFDAGRRLPAEGGEQERQGELD